jgi:hypothetical protein
VVALALVLAVEELLEELPHAASRRLASVSASSVASAGLSLMLIG